MSSIIIPEGYQSLLCSLNNTLSIYKVHLW